MWLPLDVGLIQQSFEINQSGWQGKGEEGTWDPEGGRSHEGLTKADPKQDPASHAFLASSRRCGHASWAQPAEKTL